jgi:hypothetical protein
MEAVVSTESLVKLLGETIPPIRMASEMPILRAVLYQRKRLSNSRIRLFTVSFAEFDRKGQTAQNACLNFLVDALSVKPSYVYRFNVIYKRAKMKKWSALVDDFRTFPLLKQNSQQQRRSNQPSFTQRGFFKTVGAQYFYFLRMLLLATRPLASWLGLLVS